MKLNMEDKEREKWLKGFTADFISSEESDMDDEMIVVKPLPWRSERLTNMFYRLDDKLDSSKTSQARQQKRKRVVGVSNSTRSQPDVFLYGQYCNYYYYHAKRIVHFSLM